MSRFNERKKEEGRKAPSPVMHQTGARQLRSRVRWRTPVEHWDPCRIQRRLLPGSCPEPGSASPGPGAPGDRLEGKPDKYVVGFSSACVCGARVDLLAVVVAVQGATRIIASSGKRSQLCTPFVDDCDSFVAPHCFFPLVLETVLEHFVVADWYGVTFVIIWRILWASYSLDC